MPRCCDYRRVVSGSVRFLPNTRISGWKIFASAWDLPQLRQWSGNCPFHIPCEVPIDNALPPLPADLLAAGYEAIRVGAYGMHAAKNEEILGRAFDGDRIVVSADSDLSASPDAQPTGRQMKRPRTHATLPVVPGTCPVLPVSTHQ